MFNFDLSNGYVVLRIICGLFMLPNAIAKLRNPDPSIGFFKSAGFAYPHYLFTLRLLLKLLLVLH